MQKGDMLRIGTFGAGVPIQINCVRTRRASLFHSNSLRKAVQPRQRCQITILEDMKTDMEGTVCMEGVAEGVVEGVAAVVAEVVAEAVVTQIDFMAMRPAEMSTILVTGAVVAVVEPGVPLVDAEGVVEAAEGEVNRMGRTLGTIPKAAHLPRLSICSLMTFSRSSLPI